MQQVAYNKADETTAVINEYQHTPPNVSKDLTVIKTCVFIVGMIAGAGFLSLPKAIDDTGWIGFVLLLACCMVAGYTGNLLGKCWLIVREERPELKQIRIGDPYPTIAEIAFGKPLRYIVSFSIFCTLFGGAVVYLLIAAENIRELLPANTGMNICYLTLIVGGVMTPFTLFGTPKDFWPIAAVASLVTAAASFILFVDVIAESEARDVTHSEVTVVSFFTGYGTICFAFNGHAAFPTFQSDMHEPSKFGRTILISFITVLLIYVPTTVVGYVYFGGNVDPNVILSMPEGPAKTIVSLLITAHLLFGIIILLNPVSQEIEHVLGIPKTFTWKRLLSRTTMMAAALFVAESVPHFSSILALIGGSTIAILAIICPPMLYMRLLSISTKQTMYGAIPLHMKVVYIEIMFIGVVAGVAATYSAITDLATNQFTVPCYVDPVRASQT